MTMAVQYLIVSKAIRYYAQVTVILITHAKHTRNMNVHISRENITIHLFSFTKQELSTPYVTNMSFSMIFRFVCWRVCSARIAIFPPCQWIAYCLSYHYGCDETIGSMFAL